MSPELCHLLAYWQSLGSETSPPEKSRLNLRELTSLLPWMFILEMGEDGSLRYRLAGSSLEEAVGCGMAGKTYADIFKDHEQASVMEELYATALVQGCGLVRAGAFSLDAKSTFDLEVLTLPFSDTRAMAGTILVGIVRPFDSMNQGFMEKWGNFHHDLTTLMVVPSPRIMTEDHLSDRVTGTLDTMGVELRALDIPKVLELLRRSAGGIDVSDVPWIALGDFLNDQRQNLN